MPRKLCEHNLRMCKICHHHLYCIHNRIKYRCKDCETGLCIHNRNKYKCKDCDTGYCEHNKRKDNCIECSPQYKCIHNKHKDGCKKCCNNPIHKTFKNMLSSKYSDLERNREFDLDMDFLYDMYYNIHYEEPCCYYCNVFLQFKEYRSDLITIERLNNDIGHIKSNCVFACYKCNQGRIGQRQKYPYRELEDNEIKETDNIDINNHKRPIWCIICNNRIANHNKNRHSNTKKHLNNELKIK